MAQSNWNITNFLAEVGSRGLAKPCRFEVLFNLPPCLTGQNNNAQLVSLFCDQVIFPQTDFFTSRQQIYGPSEFLPVGVQHGGDNLSMQFYVDKDMRVKNFFEDWMDKIVDRRTFHTSYKNTYITNLVIRQLDESNRITYEIKVFDVFPKTTNIINLDAGLTNQAMRLNMTFNFRRWERISKPAPGVDLSAQITSVFDPSNGNAVPGQAAITPDYGLGPWNYYGVQTQPTNVPTTNATFLVK